MDSTLFCRQISAAMVCLSFYFGWRDETAANLRWIDFTFNDATRVLEFSELFSKGALTSSHRFRLLQIPATRLPGMASLLVYCKIHLAQLNLPSDGRLLDSVCKGRRKLDAAL
jgi:hypothetical protein